MDRIEVCDQGAFFYPFKRAVREAAVKHGMEISLLHRLGGLDDSAR